MPPLYSPWWVWQHWGGFIIFRPMVWELLNFEIFFVIENSINFKNKFIIQALILLLSLLDTKCSQGRLQGSQLCTQWFKWNIQNLLLLCYGEDPCNKNFLNEGSKLGKFVHQNSHTWSGASKQSCVGIKVVMLWSLSSLKGSILHLVVLVVISSNQLHLWPNVNFL